MAENALDNYQAVILAGGLGTRLKPRTLTMPKPMIEVCGKPFLFHLINYLKRFGITDILLLTGYLGEIIENYFEDGSRFDVHISYSREPEPLGTGGALLYAKDKLKDKFILCNGDTLPQVDFYLLAQAFKDNSQACSIMLVYDNSGVHFKPNVSLDSAGLITGYDCGANTQMTYTNSGVIIIKKAALDVRSFSMPCSLENDYYPAWIKDRQLVAFSTFLRFYDMGSPGGYKEMEAFLK